MDDSDDALMERIKQRDSEALSELYHRFHVKVYSLARHVTHSRTLAQEVTQDTFMKVWNHAEHYQNRLGKFRSWLLVITHRCALDLLQHEYRKWGRLVTLKPGTKTGAKISALRLYRLADTDAEDEARWREIQSSMSRIPPEQRRSSNSIFITASVRGISPNTLAYRSAPSRRGPVWR